MPPFFAPGSVMRYHLLLRHRFAPTLLMCGLAAPASAQTTGAGGSGGLSQILILVVFVAIFYFMLIRPQQKRMKDQQAMLAKLATGDEVVTSGGILGRITDVGDTFITLEVADGVRIRVQRAQIAQLMPKGTLKGA
jgi:preprotein translocase subunit YajC